MISAENSMNPSSENFMSSPTGNMSSQPLTMSSCGASSDIIEIEDEIDARLQLQLAITDPYIYNMGNANVEETEQDEEIKPYIGLKFRTVNEAYTFYNSYACRLGFSVRKASVGKNKHGVSSVRMVCNKEGFSNWKKKMELPIRSSTNLRTPEKQKGMTRVGCKASCRIRLVGDIWRVSVFEESHNHDLITSPSKKRNLRSQKQMTAGDKEIIRDLSAQNVGTSQILEYVAVQKGGKQNVRFKKKDVSNLIAAENRKLNVIDVHTTMLYFEKRQEEDPEFFYCIDADESGVVKNIFWVDGRARRAYQEFGDVVTFDTTYQTNKYNMPFAPFIGVNHHRHSILFGMALLKCETAENFCWLFKSWLVAMYGKHPRAIITDQDPAMRKAIEMIFPNTRHRCCQWHVMRKAREHFGNLYNKLDGFVDELPHVINRSLTVADFEKGWMTMVDKFKLHDNNYVKVMYQNRDQWVPAYFRDTFFAEMSTTQRSESMNALFKLLVNNHSSIFHFVMQIEKMIESIWQKESDEDLKTKNEIPHLWSTYLMEVKARQVYTRNVFSLFKAIVKDSLLGFVTEIERDVSYQVDITAHTLYQNWVPESYVLQVDKQGYRVSCNCKGFEVNGLLCAHAIKVMHHIGMAQLPDHYILKRWTRDANASVKRSTSERSMDPGDSSELQMLRFSSTKSDLMEIGKIGASSAETYRCLKELIPSVKEKLLAVVGNQVASLQTWANDASEQQKTGKEMVLTLPLYVDPPQAQCKGRKKKATRFIPAAIKKGKKMRTCSVCGAKEGHNARTCPKKAQGTGEDKQIADDSNQSEEDEVEYEESE